MVLRHTTIITNAWFDAITPYHPTAVGVYSRLGRRPPLERVTNRNRNVAMLYATYRVLNSLMPRFADDWRAMMTSVGLDPDDSSTNLATPVGIGNRAGNAVVAARETDGLASTRFLPGGRGFVFMKGPPGAEDFWLSDRSTNTTRMIASVSKPASIGTFDVTPDGTRLVFDRVEERSNLVLIERRR
jgi:hypothetical protein